ncbi:hypothetical protein ACFCXH_00315 [Streptomyces nojiriensis]|uniref:hypothetical protein n=1 Tax=Streptomyces nojiriensis TaxID=66374 RepID=UPI0035DA334F
MTTTEQPPYFWGDEGPYFVPPPQRRFCCQEHGEGLDLGSRKAAVAIHEAGHAVVAFLLGVHVPSIELESTAVVRDCGAVTRVEGANIGVSFVGATRTTALTVLAAGVRAHQWSLRMTGMLTSERAFFAERGGTSDWERAQHLARGVDGGAELDPRDYWRHWEKADALLSPHWTAVTKVAALVVAGPVSGDVAAAACGLVNAAR